MRKPCDECSHQYSEFCCGCAYADKYGRPVFSNDPYDEDFNEQQFMIWSKPILGYRNKLAEMIMDTDRCDLIETSQLTPEEREAIRKKLKPALNYIDKQLKKTKPK